MNAIKLSERLEEAATAEDVIGELEVLTEELAEGGAGVDSVGVILRFIEEHTDLDLGLPGPLTHFVERFYRRGYEEELLESLQRRPTMLTVSMLSYLINGTRGRDRARLLGALQAAEHHPAADRLTREHARRHLRRADP
jgi:hypothetical protein